jgi:DNA-binding transcriptional MocR family regulator
VSTDTTRPLPHWQESTYTKLPNALLSELTPREHQLVHALLSFRWFDDSPIRPFVATLAGLLKCHRRTVQRTLRSLEGKGYLVTVARYRQDSDGGRTSNDYAPGPLLLPLLPRADARDDAPTDQPRQTPMTSAPHRNTYRNQTNRKNRNNWQSTPPACDLCGQPKGQPHLKGECFRT